MSQEDRLNPAGTNPIPSINGFFENGPIMKEDIAKPQRRIHTSPDSAIILSNESNEDVIDQAQEDIVMLKAHMGLYNHLLSDVKIANQVPVVNVTPDSLANLRHLESRGMDLNLTAHHEEPQEEQSNAPILSSSSVESTPKKPENQVRSMDVDVICIDDADDDEKGDSNKRTKKRARSSSTPSIASRAMLVDDIVVLSDSENEEDEHLDKMKLRSIRNNPSAAIQSAFDHAADHDMKPPPAKRIATTDFMKSLRTSRIAYDTPPTPHKLPTTSQSRLDEHSVYFSSASNPDMVNSSSHPHYASSVSSRSIQRLIADARNIVKANPPAGISRSAPSSPSGMEDVSTAWIHPFDKSILSMEEHVEKQCDFCGRRNHITIRCPRRHYVATCILCGGIHKSVRCPWAKCFNCLRTGHLAKQCEQSRVEPLCFKCGLPHSPLNCPNAHNRSTDQKNASSSSIQSDTITYNKKSPKEKQIHSTKSKSLLSSKSQLTQLRPLVEGYAVRGIEFPATLFEDKSMKRPTFIDSKSRLAIMVKANVFSTANYKRILQTLGIPISGPTSQTDVCRERRKSLEQNFVSGIENLIQHGFNKVKSIEKYAASRLEELIGKNTKANFEELFPADKVAVFCNCFVAVIEMAVTALTSIFQRYAYIVKGHHQVDYVQSNGSNSGSFKKKQGKHSHHRISTIQLSD